MHTFAPQLGATICADQTAHAMNKGAKTEKLYE